MSGRLDIIQYRILSSCADDWELFYFLFAEVNFGGQVTDDRSRRVKTPGQVIARNVAGLIHSSLLDCLRVRGDLRRIELTDPDEGEFDVYDGYDCSTFDKHLERFGYGPHEFRTTRAGVEEIEKSFYNAYDAEISPP